MKNGRTKVEMETKSEPEAVPSYEVVKGLSRTKIKEISIRVAELARQRSEIDTELKELQQEGAKILAVAEVKTVMVGELRVTRYDGMNVSLSRDRLFELGVSKKKLDMATTRTPWMSLKVTAPKPSEDDS